MTNSGGGFYASFIVPYLSTSTGKVIVTAAAVNPSMPGNLDVAPSHAVHVMP